MSKFIDLSGLTSFKKKIESWIDTKVSGLSKGLIYMDVVCNVGGITYLSSSGGTSSEGDIEYPPLELHQGYIINASCYSEKESVADIIIDVKSGEIYLGYCIYDSTGLGMTGRFTYEEGATDYILLEVGLALREVNANALYFIYQIK